MLMRTVTGLICALCVGGGLWLAAQAGDSPKPEKDPAANEKDRVQEKDEKPAPKKPKEKLASKVMRKKLAAAQDILEGLTTEDYEMIGRGASTLKLLSEEADFQISTNLMYLHHANEFKSLADKLEQAAKKISLDKASLHYVNLMMNCIECHRFVRDVLVAGD